MKVNFPTSCCLATSLLALLFLSCAKDDPEGLGISEDEKLAPRELLVSLDETGTRVAMEDDGVSTVRLTWEPDDELHVWADNGKSYRFATSAERISADGKSANFLCEAFPESSSPELASSCPIVDGNTRGDLAYLWIDVEPFLTQDLSTVNLPLRGEIDTETDRMFFRPAVALFKVTFQLPDAAAGATVVRQIEVRGMKGNFDYGIFNTSRLKYGTLVGEQQLFPAWETDFPVVDGTVTFYLGIAAEAEAKKSYDKLWFSFTTDLGDEVYTADKQAAAFAAGRCYPFTIAADKWSLSKPGSSVLNPVRITSEEDLRTAVGWEDFCLLENDIEVHTSADNPWTGLLSSEANFRGVFDGNNHTISFPDGFHVSFTPSSGQYLGFIGKCEGGQICNLTIQGDMIFEGPIRTTLNAVYAGAICSYICDGTVIRNCVHEGSIRLVLEERPNAIYAGGICGAILNCGQIAGCVQRGGDITVSSTSEIQYTGSGFYIGGICGEVGSSSYEETLVYQSTNEGCNISIQPPVFVNIGLTPYIGLLAGHSHLSGRVCSCTTVTGDPEISYYLVGKDTPTVTKRNIGYAQNTRPECEGH